MKLADAKNAIVRSSINQVFITRYVKDKTYVLSFTTYGSQERIPVETSRGGERIYKNPETAINDAFQLCANVLLLEI